MKTLTNLESITLITLIDLLTAEPGFSDVDINDISKEMKESNNKLRGVLGSLVQKGIVTLDENDSGFVIIYLNEEYWYLHPEWAGEVETGVEQANDWRLDETAREKFVKIHKGFKIVNTWNSDGYVVTTEDPNYFEDKVSHTVGYRHCGNHLSVDNAIKSIENLIGSKEILNNKALGLFDFIPEPLQFPSIKHGDKSYKLFDSAFTEKSDGTDYYLVFNETDDHFTFISHLTDEDCDGRREFVRIEDMKEFDLTLEDISTPNRYMGIEDYAQMMRFI